MFIRNYEIIPQLNLISARHKRNRSVKSRKNSNDDIVGLEDRGRNQTALDCHGKDENTDLYINPELFSCGFPHSSLGILSRQ